MKMMASSNRSRTSLTALPLLLYVCLASLQLGAHAAEYSYKLEFEIMKAKLATAEKFRTLGPEFKDEMATVLKGCFAATLVSAVKVDEVYYARLVSGFTSNTLQLDFTATSAESSKPIFNTGDFAEKMTTDMGLVLRSWRLDGAASEAVEGEGGEEGEGGDDEAAAATPDRPLSRQMSRVFAIIGIVFIGVLLIAGYLVDLRSAKNSKSAP